MDCTNFKKKSKLGTILISIACFLVAIGTILYYLGAPQMISLAILLTGVIGLTIIGIFGTIAMVGYIEQITKKKTEKENATLSEEEMVKKENVPLRVTLTELMFYIFSLLVVVSMCCLLLCGLYTGSYLGAAIFQIIAILVFDFIIIISASDKDVRSIRLVYIYTVINIFYTVIVYFLSRETSNNYFGITLHNKYTTCFVIIDFVLIYVLYPFYIKTFKEVTEKGKIKKVIIENKKEEKEEDKTEKEIEVETKEK